ncbi:uncharacterized protein LOC116919854 [Daphnia magna]|uniref:uncharacterized protein LOC116919854 n=1 Tax=Daphnia magna TaxID=35525 RepID=UPI001E1BD2C5|nr:uncharacterized protein LOC116919854 [Daphnia magna]XP_045026362.1 uncharacterized protein LOC116919854 [Daphnia magna]
MIRINKIPPKLFAGNMVKLVFLIHHLISHLEFVMIWLVTMLKLSDYWIVTGYSECLPTEWIYYLYIVDQMYQKSLIWIGLGCSVILNYSAFIKRIFPAWNIALGSLWIVLLLLVSPVWEISISLILCAAATVQLILGLSPRKSKQAFYKPKTKILQTSISNPSWYSTSSPPCDLDLSKLDIGSSRKINNSTPLASPMVQSSGFAKPRPLISPSRLSSSSIISSPDTNLTKASWVAGGYWQGDNWPSSTFSSPNHNSPFTRSSSQSSGFGSIQTGLLNRSPPDSRPDSTLEDIDRFSVFSDNLDPRHVDSSLRFQENSPCLYQSPSNELSRKSLVSSISSTNASVHHTSVAPLTSQWSWLPFMLGFSLAVNVCVLTYFGFLHYSKVGNVVT